MRTEIFLFSTRSWLEVPAPEGLKKGGWKRYYAVLNFEGLTLFPTETDRGPRSVLCVVVVSTLTAQLIPPPPLQSLAIHIEELHSATPVRPEDLHHAKAAEIPRVFQVSL